MSVTQALKHILPVHADDGAVPLKLRLRAWWHGASVQEVLAAEAERGGGDNAAVLELIGAVVEEPEPEGPGAFWSNSRIAVTEMLFGNGEIVPGGTEGTLDMIGAFGLGQEVNVLNIGAGLGGSARAIASEYEGWVTAYEPDAALAEAALDPARLRNLKKTTGGSSLKPMKVRMKLSDKATIQHADLETLEIKPGVYDCAFSRDVLFTVANRSRLVEGIFEGLKPFSPFVFTDYFVAEGAADDPRVLRWMQSEPPPGPSLDFRRGREDADRHRLRPPGRPGHHRRAASRHLTGLRRLRCGPREVRDSWRYHRGAAGLRRAVGQPGRGHGRGAGHHPQVRGAPSQGRVRRSVPGPLPGPVRRG